jgi:4-hydroxy-tetrahydrodipicolinate synthase
MMTNGDWEAAQAENEALADFFKTLFIETSPGPVKYMLELLGQMTGTLRLPLVMPEPETRQKIKDCLINMGLISEEEAAEKP